MKVISAEVMQQLDRRTISEFGIPGLELMERAGTNCAEIVASRYGGVAAPSALVLAGKGNNGGDGYVIARLLAIKGWQVRVIVLAGRSEITGDAGINLHALPAEIPLQFVDGADPDVLSLTFDGATVLVDALLGTGLKSHVTGLYAEAISRINASGLPVVAVDIPSGVDATSGRILGSAVRADCTVTFALAKTGHVVYPGAAQTGQLFITDIGIPGEISQAAPGAEFLDEAAASSLLKPRSRTAHKGSFGHCLIVAGSTGKTGAAAMAANSAMRAGAGLVTLGVPEALNPIMEIKTSEAMTVPLPDCGRGYLSTDALDEIQAHMKRCNVLGIGPGLGHDSYSFSLVRNVVASALIPVVIDADGLNAFAGRADILKESSAPHILLTPHPGEMSRLAALTVAEVEADRLGVAANFARDNKVYLVLKGARTVIAAPDGRLAINGSGNPGMASGGMGDVLSGVLTALIAQGYEPFAACCLGVYIHGKAGDMVAADKGEMGLIATDVQEMLPYAFNLLRTNGNG